jgi:ATPase domain predominantly from Archaea
MPRTFVQNLIGHGFSRHRPVTPFEDFELWELDLTQLKLNIHWFVPFIAPRQQLGSGKVTPRQVKQFWQSAEDNIKQRQKITVLLVGGALDAAADDPVLAELAERGVVVWDQRAMKEVAEAADTQSRYKAISLKLVEAVGRGALSPYVSGRPAIGGRFFGRSGHLRQYLADDSNCTIIGNRRIGKTSLLKEMRERLKLRGYRTAEIYGATTGDSLSFVTQLLYELGEYRKAQQVERNNYHINRVPRWIKQMAAEKPVAVFVDELDHILEFDSQQKYGLIHMLRGIFESNAQCRIFFAGFRLVMKEKQSSKSPLFNFTKTVELEGFSREETFEMVTKPLAHLGIDVADTELPKEIYQTTAGHPEHIQICCAELIDLYESTGKLPDTVALVNRVIDSADYKQKVMGAFLSNTNPFEQLVCYLLMKDAGDGIRTYEFDPAKLRLIINNKVGDGLAGEDKVDGVTTNLVVSGILMKVTGGVQTFRFASPMLAAYCKGLNLDMSIEKALKEVEKQPDLYYTPPVPSGKEEN